MKRDDRTIRAKLITLVLGSLFFIAGAMGPIAVSISKHKDTEFARRIRDLPGARVVVERQRGETDRAAADMGIAATLLLGFTLACGLLASRGIVRRLRELTEAAERMQRGDFGTPLHVEADTELDQLAAALEGMRNELSHSVELSRRKVELEKDLAIAAVVQGMFLPHEEHAEGQRFALEAFYRPASSCGGDFWWQHQLEDGSLLLLLGDVTGHGTGPAMITAAMASATQALLGEGFGAHPERLLERLSDALRDICDGSFLMTVCALRVDARHGVVELFNAGAPPVLVAKADGSVDVLAASGTPLGGAELSLGLTRAELAPGSRLLAFTDGVPERAQSTGQPLGMRRLRKLLGQGAGAPLAQLKTTLRASLEHEEPAHEDDMTFVLVELSAS